MQRYAKILSKLKGLKKAQDGWQTLCPAHEDTNASLSVRIGEEGRLLLKCHAGCTTEAVVAALGVSMSDLFPPGSSKPAADQEGPRRKIVKTYDYQDVDGNLVFQVVRFEPKGFSQRRPDPNPESPGKWLWNLTGVQALPYLMPRLHKTPRDHHVWIVEGEKDADRMTAAGLVATTNPGGAGKWRPAYNEVFRDRPVVVVADNDEPGRKHAADVAAHLRPVAKSVVVLDLPVPEHGDVSDYLAKHRADELIELAHLAEEGGPPAEQPATTAEPPAPRPALDDDQEAEIKREVRRRSVLMLDTAEGMLHDTIRRFFLNLKEMCKVE
ncbi:MAG TPA: hypothetical protein VM389_13135 [Phycisphaerae bacterium]|nr:hypothetical protein [Phycisphaerae bacterium]